MITKDDRDILRRLWASEDPDDNEWRQHLNEEQTALVLLWDLMRREEEDEAARDWWTAKMREEVGA